MGGMKGTPVRRAWRTWDGAHGSRRRLEKAVKGVADANPQYRALVRVLREASVTTNPWYETASMAAFLDGLAGDTRRDFKAVPRTRMQVNDSADRIIDNQTTCGDSR